MSGSRRCCRRPLWVLCVALVLLTSPRCDAASKGQRKENSQPGTFAGGDDSSSRRDLGSDLVEELDAFSFEEKVADVVNGTEAMDYTPFVMFHVSWCEHCRAAIPEFEEAASQVAQAVRENRLSQFSAPPKFFTVVCDSPNIGEVCNIHASKSHPVLIMFRSGRSFIYNRPRTAQVISWWAVRTTRPAIVEIQSKEQLDSYASQELCFMLHADAQQDSELLEVWEDVALQYLEEYSFLHIMPGAFASVSLPAAPSVHVQAPPAYGLKPLPFDGKLDHESLEAWVNFNRFPPVISLNPWTAIDATKSHLTVVTYVHPGGKKGGKARRAFDKKAAELRPDGHYLFAAVNASDEDAAHLLAYHFPILASSVTTLPRLFAFVGHEGGVRYWEDPAMSKMEDLTPASIESLLSNPEALQDGSTVSWVKEKRKLYIRFASKSAAAAGLALGVPLVTLAFCWKCCRALSSSDEEPKEQEKAVKVD